MKNAVVVRVIEKKVTAYMVLGDGLTKDQAEERAMSFHTLQRPEHGPDIMKIDSIDDIQANAEWAMQNDRPTKKENTNNARR